MQTLLAESPPSAVYQRNMPSRAARRPTARSDAVLWQVTINEVVIVKDKVKVLIIAGTMDVGGIENQLMHLLRQADKEKFSIDFTTTMDHPFYREEIEELGSRCIRIPNTEKTKLFRYCRAIYRVMRDGKYDVVHSHELFHSGIVLLTARLAGVKHRFVHAHNWMEGNDPHGKKSVLRRTYNFLMQRLIVRNATDFIACSSLAGRFLYGDAVTHRANYHLLFNSVDTSKFLDNYDFCESGEFCDEGWLNVIQVGRYTPVKNQLFTVQIAKELKKRGKKIRILSAGNDENDYGRMVRATIQEYGLEEHMILLGIRKDVDSLMRKSSAFLLPSLYEGMPLVMIEAQAAGLPCVTADTYSREVDFGLGSVIWLRLEQSASEWADAVEAATAQGRLPKAAVMEAIERKGFDSKEFSRKLCNLYERAMDR